MALTPSSSRNASPPCPRFAIGHARIDTAGFEETVEKILQLACSGAPAMVVTPNADHIVTLETDLALRAAYESAALVVPDGMPLVWASRLLRGPLKERVTGADLMPRLCAVAPAHGLRVFILGGRPGVPEEAARRLQLACPGLVVAGAYSPPFGFERDPVENEAIVAAIRSSGADLVFVGLGAPKQELWMHRHLARFDKGVFLGCGAAVDFCAGAVRRAPQWMQSAGLEWLYRLTQDPSRLAKRYARDLYLFVVLARDMVHRHGRRTRAGV
jgi:N-acetylglucosaminyldiphosphoundecaprenol N-acetyl-beta-D-mannosaminyltransferase